MLAWFLLHTDVHYKVPKESTLVKLMDIVTIWWQSDKQATSLILSIYRPPTKLRKSNEQGPFLDMFKFGQYEAETFDWYALLLCLSVCLSVCLLEQLNYENLYIIKTVVKFKLLPDYRFRESIVKFISV